MDEFGAFVKKLEEITSDSRFAKSVAAAAESQDFIYARWEELVKRYPDQWIAVYRKEVIGHGDNLMILVRKLREEGVPLEDIALEKLSSKGVPVALQSII